MLLIVISGLLISQVATLYIVSRDRAAANGVVDLYRLNDRAFSLVELMSGATPEERKATAAGCSTRLTRSPFPTPPRSPLRSPATTNLPNSKTSWSAGCPSSASPTRACGGSATREADDPALRGKDIGQVERDLLVLAADFAQSDKLTASLRFSDGQWLNFTEPITPAGPILSFDSLPLYC